jgi:putative monooxygenase
MATKGQSTPEDRVESIHRGNAKAHSIAEGVWVHEFASKKCGAMRFSTGTALFDVSSVLPNHKHSVSEAIVILRGKAHIEVEGRRYILVPFDCLHVPAGVAHEVTNCSENSELLALSAFASENLSREFVQERFAIEERGLSNPSSRDPEYIVRFAQAETYALSEGTEFRDLFAGRLGSVGICGGYGRFQPGASLPCHTHRYDESITIIDGQAICLVQGERYQLSGYDTAFVPEGRPHRFLNHSNSFMAMVWVYAGSEPERTLVSSSYCDGTLRWPGKEFIVGTGNTGM